MKRQLLLALLLAAGSPAAFAQFQLFQVNGNAEQPVPPVFGFGSVNAGDTTSASFRLRNTSGTAAQFDGITVAGTGFLSITAPFPATLDSQASFDFVVSFQPASAGSFSATLQAPGISVLLTGTAVPALTYQVITALGAQPLSGSVDFGKVTLGSTAVLRFAIQNQTVQPLLVPSITVSGADFAMSGATPSGTSLQPTGSAILAVAFTPGQAGARAGSLAIDSRVYPLTGTGQAPVLPKATLNLTLQQSQSGQQGSVAVSLDSASPTAASGTVSLSFAPAAGVPSNSSADPAIAFASGGQTAGFTVNAGGTAARFGGQASAAFATGTTAGTLTFTLQFGGATLQQSVTMTPAAVGLAAVEATRQSGSIMVVATGFDNTRSAGKLSFTFYDISGNPIPPGAIAADASANFAAYFPGSMLGGEFALTAVFPVTGIASQIAAFDLAVTNSAGTTRSARTSF